MTRLTVFLFLISLSSGLALFFNHVNPVGEHNYIAFLLAYFGAILSSATIALSINWGS